MTSNTGSGGVSGQYPNQGAYQEVVVQTRALPAEIGAGGVSVNMITQGRRRHAPRRAVHHLHRQVAAERQRQRRTDAPAACWRRAPPTCSTTSTPASAGRSSRQAVVLRQRAPLPRRSLRGEHLQPGRLASARREPDLERDRQADLADQPGQPPVELRRLQLQAPRSPAADDSGLSVRVAGSELLLAAVGARRQREADVDAAAEPAARFRFLVVLRAVVARLPAGPCRPTRCRVSTSRARR